MRGSLGLKAILAINRGLAFGDRLLSRGHQLLAELPLVAFRDDWAHEASLDYYNRAHRYTTADSQAAGLYPFETRMLDRFFPAPPARLLVHGCGGGRELLALAQKGYQLEGYEPAPFLAASTEHCLDTAGLGPLAIGRLDLQSWAGQPTGPFDGAWLGWGAWAHIVSQQDRIAVLSALSQSVRHGPILLSFFRGDALFDHLETLALPRPLTESATTRLRRVTRKWVRERMLSLRPLERGTAWDRGFYCHLTEEWELREEATTAGCEVLYYEQDANRYPHAVLRAKT